MKTEGQEAGQGVPDAVGLGPTGEPDGGAAPRRVGGKPWAVLATAWELLAISFRYPADDLCDAAHSGEWRLAANEVLAALGSEERLELLDCERMTGGMVQRRLRAEATRLFVGTPLPAVSPYEGVFLAKEEGHDALKFVNPRSMEVRRFMHACGFARAEGPNDPLDHVAAECELMERLALSTSEAAYERFLKGHARKWMPSFAQAVEKEAQESFFVQAARLMSAVVERA